MILWQAGNDDYIMNRVDNIKLTVNGDRMSLTTGQNGPRGWWSDVAAESEVENSTS